MNERIIGHIFVTLVYFIGWYMGYRWGKEYGKRVILEETTFNPTQEDIIAFLNKPCNPQLTEDERVILRNLRYEKGAYEYTKIGRTELDSEGRCDLILIDSDNESVWWGEYGHLFQFIKNGEEYSIQELLEEK